MLVVLKQLAAFTGWFMNVFNSCSTQFTDTLVTSGVLLFASLHDLHAFCRLCCLCDGFARSVILH